MIEKECGQGGISGMSILETGMHTGQLFTLLIIALALGMDAFSLGVGIGMRGIRLRDIIKLSVVIAIFHIVMPLMACLPANTSVRFLVVWRQLLQACCLCFSADI